MWRSASVLLVIVLAGCAGDSVGSTVATDLASASAAAATFTPAPTPSPTMAPSREPTAAPTVTPAPSPEPRLTTGGMAEVVADSVVVRSEPGRQSAFVIQPCTGHGGPCPNWLLGPNTGTTRVYLIDGPVQADGYEWYLASGGSLFPEFVGWIPTGDSGGPWVVPAEPQCPREPIELADVTYAAIPRLELLACVGNRELVLVGWLPAPPPSDGGIANDVCVPLPGREAFCDFGYTILRPVEGEWAGSADHLPWIGETAAGLLAPPRNAWVTIRGSFDHPGAAECFERDPYSILSCQTEFVVTSIALP